MVVRRNGFARKRDVGAYHREWGLQIMNDELNEVSLLALHSREGCLQIDRGVFGCSDALGCPFRARFPSIPGRQWIATIPSSVLIGKHRRSDRHAHCEVISCWSDPTNRCPKTTNREPARATFFEGTRSGRNPSADSKFVSSAGLAAQPSTSIRGVDATVMARTPRHRLSRTSRRADPRTILAWH